MTRPMYRKYYETWRTYADTYGPRTALLYQVGGFFEIYDTENLATGTTQANIRDIAELCQLSLTVHPVEDTETQTLFGGFPEHALGKFEKILVQAGYTVVVVVQKKGRTGAVEDRVVDHIASPGCYTEGTKERRLVAVCLESLCDGPRALMRCLWAVSALDLATGRVWVAEGTDRDRLHQFLCVHQPAELVLYSDGGAGASSIADHLTALACPTHLKCLATANATLELAALDRFWPAARKQLPWIHTFGQARRCLAALMTFAADHLPSAVLALDDPELWVPDQEVRLGNAALEQLGLLSLRQDERQSLLGMMDRCRTMSGRRLLRARLLRPITDLTELERRLTAVEQCRVVWEVTGESIQRSATERHLRSIYDLSRLWRRVELASASMNDMACLLRSYDAVRALDALGWQAPANVCEFVEWVRARWDAESTTQLAREGHEIPVVSLPWLAGYHEELRPLFTEGTTIREAAAALCTEWSGKGRSEQLYLDDAEGGGFRMTGTKRRISAVLAALQDEGDTSARIVAYKSSAVLENAALEALSNQHREWRTRWLLRWAETWTTAQRELCERGREAQVALERWCAELDVAWTSAQLAKEWLWKRPEFVAAEEGVLIVEGLRHPILERLSLTGTNYIAHSIAFGAKETVVGCFQTPAGLLLYGMNASGKSSLMKAVGLCVLLAQAGFPVPAARCRLSPFTAIFTRILGNDNLWAGLSSFAVEMTELREVLRFADERSLVLGDELCSGTESLSATALVAAGVEVLARRSTKFIFATHLHELAALPDIVALTDVRAAHLRVHYDAGSDTLVYNRQLAAGSGSALYGLEVCRALDLPAEYLGRATHLRKTLAGWQAPQISAYSSAVVVEACAICSGKVGLETHHIRPQAEAAAAAAAGFNIHGAGNLVCLCAACHDDHHSGRLRIDGWEDTVAGRRLRWQRSVAAATAAAATAATATAAAATAATAAGAAEPRAEVVAWVREQRQLKIRIPTIQRMAHKIFGIQLTEAFIRGVRCS